MNDTPRYQGPITGMPIFDAKHYQEILAIATENREFFFGIGTVGPRTIYDAMENAPEEIQKEFREGLMLYHGARMNGIDHQRADKISGLASRV